MKRNLKTQNGFGLIETLLILILVSIIGFAGYYVYTQNKDDTNTANNAGKHAETNANPDSALSKTYTNKDVSLTFKYPSDWTVTEDLTNPRDWGLEGSITITSPSGITVNFDPTYGGKGGACEDDPSDKPHNTLNCNTLEVLSKEKVAFSGAADTYLIKYRFTEARDETGKPPVSEYGIFLDSRFEPGDMQTPIIGAVFNMGEVQSKEEGKVAIDTHVSGDGNRNQSFFDMPDVRLAEQILKSASYL